MPHDIPCLEAHPFLESVDAQRIRRLEPRPVHVAGGAFVFREGDSADTLYLLCKGHVSLELNMPTRGPTRLETLGPGDILGLSWNFAPYRWSLDARAVDDVNGFAISAAQLRRCAAEDPALGHLINTHLLHQVYQRLERVRMQRLDLYRVEP